MIAIYKRNTIVLTGILLSLLFSQSLLANDAGDLHRSSCIACHTKMTGGDGGLLYKRSDRIVNNKSELEQRVAYCARGANTNWSSTDIAAVANYLNEIVYKFPE